MLRVIWGLALAMFLAALDQTIVAIALYSIARDLHGESLMPWLIGGYLVVATVASPLYGKLSDLYGRWPMLAIAIGIYLVASVASMLAQSMPQLLAFRLLQGLGGGGLIVLVQTVIADLVPPGQRGRYQGYLSGVFATAAVVGPVVGGLLTEFVGWRAVFALNLPLGIAAFLIVRRDLRGLVRRATRRAIDYPGAVLLGICVATLMVGLTRMGQGASPLDSSSLALFTTSVVAGVLLVWREHRAIDPVLPPSLFRNRTVVICCSVIALNFVVMFGCIVLVPLGLQTVGAASVAEVAFLMLPLTLGVPLASFLSGKTMHRHGPRHRMLLVGGSLLCAIGVALLASLPIRPGIGTGIGLGLVGLGVGFTIPASIVATQAAVPLSQLGIATATGGLFRTLGGAIGIAVMSTALFAAVLDGTGTRGTIEAATPGTTINQADTGSSGRVAITADTRAILAHAPPERLNEGFAIAFKIGAVAALLAGALATGLTRRAPAAAN